MAASVQDATILWAVAAHFGGPGVTSSGQPLPPISVPKLPASQPGAKPLSGGKIGICWPWFKDAEPEVIAACTAALEALAVSRVPASRRSATQLLCHSLCGLQNVRAAVGQASVCQRVLIDYFASPLSLSGSQQSRRQQQPCMAHQLPQAMLQQSPHKSTP